MAEKDGDVAYAGSDWNDGVLPWEYGLNLDLEEADPLLRGTVFTDRGVYKLGRRSPLQGDPAQQHARRRPAAARRHRRRSIAVRDSRDKVVDERIVKVNALEHGGMDADGAGRGSARQLLRARHPRERPARSRPRRQPVRRSATERDYREYKKTVSGDRSWSPPIAARTSAST